MNSNRAFALKPAHPFPALLLGLLLAPLLAAPQAQAQGTLADYQRSEAIGDSLGAFILNQPASPTWIGETERLWYRATVEGGHEWRLVEASVPRQGPLFDHERMARAVSAATGTEFGAAELPFTANSARFQVEDDLSAIRFTRNEQEWRCSLSTYECVEWEGEEDASPDDVVTSPDEAWEAFIRNYNVAIRPAGGDEGDVVMLSHDGSEGNRYLLRSIRWSPDSRKIVAYRRIPGYQRVVHFVRSSPPDQLQPILETTRTLNQPEDEDSWGNHYRKPGDVVDSDQPVLFDVASRSQITIDRTLFPNPYSLQFPQWWEDSRGFTFEYNERAHQTYRVIEVDAGTGGTRTLIEERAETFFNYNGTRWRHDVADGSEILWRSERDGWKHLWLYDGGTGQLKNQVTRGPWVVRDVQHVDEENRQIYFSASGMDPDQDPYYVHFYRIDFDGSGLVRYTQDHGHHILAWSPSRQYYVTSWSRVDAPDVMELRRAPDQGTVMELARTEISGLEAAGWQAPEPFVAKARDGVTDIWGVIIRPTNFDPTRRYPVIENIYAGPQGSFVPKSFGLQTGMLSLAELGFIVVQIDGMGTNNRSKAFHDVAWRNLGDAGFPDRRLWHEAVAETYDWYDLSRVGIYGGSAGGQNALGGLLFHPDFYHVAVAANGCHDNRMDKIWWNELWMGWPLGPHYGASSNVDNAHRLQGELLLIVGELDTNVDPSSTIQVADALRRAGKYFDMLYLTNTGHSGGGDYGNRRRNDHFVQHLLGVTPPRWNRMAAAGAAADDGGASAGDVPAPRVSKDGAMGVGFTGARADDPHGWFTPPASELPGEEGVW